MSGGAAAAAAVAAIISAHSKNNTPYERLTWALTLLILAGLIMIIAMFMIRKEKELKKK